MRGTGVLIGAVGAVALALAAGSAAAQNVGIGTTKGGATAQVSAAIAKVVSTKSGVQMRPQPYANTSQYIPLVNSGRLEFGVSNIFQAWYAVKGKGMSAGRPNPDLRLVAVLFPFRVGLYVSAKSGVKSVADLKGKTLPGFKNTALGTYLINGMLANAGMALDSVKRTPVPNFPRMWASYKQGSLDAAIAAVGSKPTYDFKASLGPQRILGVDPAPAKLVLLRKYLPQSFVISMPASKKLPGLAAKTNVLAFDYVMFAHKSVPAATVAKVVTALYDNPEDLRATSPLWRGFKPGGMLKDVGLTYHPGAINVFMDKGIWPAKK